MRNRIDCLGKAQALLVAALLWISGAPESAWAAPQITQSYEYYEIHGADETALRRQMDRFGPRGCRGGNYDAFTRWVVNWSYNYLPIPGQCQPFAFEVKADIVTFLPKWLDYTEGPDPLRQKWLPYITALKAHEDQHRELAVAAAAEVEAHIRDIGPQGSCEALADRVQAMGNRVVNLYRGREQDFDRRTGHGADEGAIFP